MKTASTLGGVAACLCISCGHEDSGIAWDTTAPVVHLDQALARARVNSAPAPALARNELTWRFDEPRTDWNEISPERIPELARITLEPLSGCLRLSIAAPDESAQYGLVGAIVVSLGDESRNDWAGLRARARTRDRMAGIAAACNVDDAGDVPKSTVPVFSDGSVQEYFLPFPSAEREPSKEDASSRPMNNVAFFVAAPRSAALDVLSITLVPRGATYLDNHGVQSITRESVTRQTIFAHVPATLTWDVSLPKTARLDFGLTCLPGESIAYRITLKTGNRGPSVLLDERIDDALAWKQCSLDLSQWAGTNGELSFEARSEVAGAVGFWGAPILSSARPSSRPNVIFYVIDGGGADLMSLYGYNRRTTPYLERLATEGVVFERAHSNSTWTQPSTASFMTSLHHSVLGGLRRGVNSTPVPAGAVTMAEHMRRGGYQTAVFTSNPNAGRIIGLERGVDMMRDVLEEHHSTSSAYLHDMFWEFRREYPGSPYWVHFQTTDVHEPHEPIAPFAGLFVSPEDQARLDAANLLLTQQVGDLFGTMSVTEFYDIGLEQIGIDRRAYFNVCRGLYDETMAHQDRELARFVGELKASGEWENTLLVIAADHGHPACTFARFGRGLIEPAPEFWQGALFDAYNTRVPLIFIWPGKIAGGRRIEQPVSMIDVLPTILELCDLPPAEIAQGRSLAPLLLGRELAPTPVILDEFRVDDASGEMVGNIEIIDGRWGASLEIGPVPDGGDPSRGRHAIPAGGRWSAAHTFFTDPPRLLLYDLSNDPFVTHAVNDKHPELVERYRNELLERWELHRTLAQRFREIGGDRTLPPEVLRQLQALGYIR